jgi:outer membrane immunogenic protein
MRVRRILKIGLVAATMVSSPLAAEAADSIPSPVYRPPPMPLAYSWSGFYVGGHAGLGWISGGNSDTGFLGGGQAGFNYQIGQWVLGAEGQISATSIKETASANFTLPGFAVGTAGAEAKLDWLSTFAARAGWAFDRWLVYGKVGGAWAHTSVNASATVNTVIGSASASVFSQPDDQRMDARPRQRICAVGQLDGQNRIQQDGFW